MTAWYFMAWADDEELVSHRNDLKKQADLKQILTDIAEHVAIKQILCRTLSG